MYARGNAGFLAPLENASQRSWHRCLPEPSKDFYDMKGGIAREDLSELVCAIKEGQQFFQEMLYMLLRPDVL
jgi:hypothetical protein